MPVIYTAIVGMRFYPGANRKVRALRADEPVELRRERDNRHDPNAAAIHVRDHKVGHIPASDVVVVRRRIRRRLRCICDGRWTAAALARRVGRRIAGD